MAGSATAAKCVTLKGEMTRRIVLISTADGNSNEGRIVRNLHAVLQQTLQVRLVMTRLHKRSVFGALSGVLRQIRCVAQSDDVVIHSPFVLSAPAAFAARLLRKRLIAFVWDSYPVLIAGRRYDRRISRWLFDRFEILVPWLVTTKIIPTHDFYIDPKYHKAQVIPFWTGLTEHAGKGQTGVRGASGPRKIALIGQINETRGVAQALLHLDKILVHPAEVHLFSRDPAPEICAMPFEKLTVQHHGFLGHDAMLERLRGFDFGLVTLHPQFDMPGFPSKT